MNKKILTSMFAFALLLPCFALFAACGPTPPPPAEQGVTYEEAVTQLNGLNNYSTTTNVNLSSGEAGEPTTYENIVLKVADNNAYIALPDGTEIYCLDGIIYKKGQGETALEVYDTGTMNLFDLISGVCYGDFVEYFKQLALAFGDDVVSIKTNENGTSITITANATTAANSMISCLKTIFEADTMEGGINALLAPLSSDEPLTLEVLKGMLKEAINTETTFSDLLTVVCAVTEIDKNELLAMVDEISSLWMRTYTNIIGSGSEQFQYGNFFNLDINQYLELPVLQTLGITTQQDFNNTVDLVYTILQQPASNLPDVFASFMPAGSQELEIANQIYQVMATLCQATMQDLSLKLILNFDADGNFTDLGLKGVCKFSVLYSGLPVSMEFAFDSSVKFENVGTTVIALPADATIGDKNVLITVVDFDAENPVIALDRSYLTANFDITISDVTYASYDATAKTLTLTSEAIAYLTSGANLLELIDESNVDIIIKFVTSTPAEMI